MIKKILKSIYFIFKVVVAGMIVQITVGYMIFEDDLLHFLKIYESEIILGLVVLGIVILVVKNRLKNRIKM